MKKNLSIVYLVLFLILIPYFLHSQNDACEEPQWDWSKDIQNDLTPGSLTYDSHGNLIFGGTFENSLDLGDTTLTSHGVKSSYLSKYDSTGKLLWAKVLSGNTYLEDLAISEDKLLILLGHHSDTLGNLSVSQYNLDGYQQWIKYAEKFESGSSLNIETDAEENFYIGGMFDGIIQFEDVVLEAERSGSTFITKYSSDGNLIWAKRSPSFILKDIAINSNGDVFLAGFFIDSFEFKDETVNLYLSSSEGGVYFQYSSMGDEISYNYAVKAPIYGYLTSIKFDKNDNLIIGGGFHSTETSAEDTATTIIGSDKHRLNYSFVAKYDEQQEFLWSKTLSPIQQSVNVSLAIDEKGDIFIAKENFLNHALEKFDLSGNKRWEILIVPYLSTGVLGFNLALNPMTNTLGVAGGYNVSASFGDTTYLAEENSKTYLAQLNTSTILPSPQTAATNIILDKLSESSIHLSWEKGDGDGHIVLMKKLGKVNPFNIEDGMEYQDGDGLFGDGTQTGEREFVVYKGTDNEVTINGLQEKRPYQIAVIEYNEDAFCQSSTNYFQEDVLKKVFILNVNKKNEIWIYPNPTTTESFTIASSENISVNDELIVKNAYGKVILRKKLTSFDSIGKENSINVSIPNIASGIYFVEVTGKTPLRLVKK